MEGLTENRVLSRLNAEQTNHPIDQDLVRMTCVFAAARDEHPISDATLTKMLKLYNYLQTRFKLAFGNRIMKQMFMTRSIHSISIWKMTIRVKIIMANTIRVRTTQENGRYRNSLLKAQYSHLLKYLQMNCQN